MAAVALGLGLFFVGVDAPAETAPDPVRGNMLALASGVFWALTVCGLRWMGSATRERAGPRRRRWSRATSSPFWRRCRSRCRSAVTRAGDWA